jgi:hypothetical protein
MADRLEDVAESGEDWRLALNTRIDNASVRYPRPIEFLFWGLWTVFASVIFPMFVIAGDLNKFRRLSIKATATHQPFPTLAFFPGVAFSLIVICAAVCFGYIGWRQLNLLRRISKTGITESARWIYIYRAQTLWSYGIQVFAVIWVLWGGGLTIWMLTTQDLSRLSAPAFLVLAGVLIVPSAVMFFGGRHIRTRVKERAANLQLRRAD